mmetsp:Transcript_21582/g.17933  ORF Transcript_21582/g.17933 Transcript_21582/m.17933 type:complete len:207 (+) Transcript_21582:160-780(+)
MLSSHVARAHTRARTHKHKHTYKSCVLSSHVAHADTYTHIDTDTRRHTYTHTHIGPACYFHRSSGFSKWLCLCVCVSVCDVQEYSHICTYKHTTYTHTLKPCYFLEADKLPFARGIDSSLFGLLKIFFLGNLSFKGFLFGLNLCLFSLNSSKCRLRLALPTRTLISRNRTLGASLGLRRSGSSLISSRCSLSLLHLGLRRVCSGRR